MSAPRDYDFDGAQGLVDLSWSQSVLLIQQDDINKDLLYNQYPYQEADEQEDMEVDDWVPGNTRSARMAAPAHTRCLYHCPEATYATFTKRPSASPWSIDTDMDTGMGIDNLSVGSTKPDAQKEAPQEAPPQGSARE